MRIAQSHTEESTLGSNKASLFMKWDNIGTKYRLT